MRKLLIAGSLLLLLGLANPAVWSRQSAQVEPAPTLVPPTPIPRQDTGELDILPSESAVARIRESEQVNVGILFNAPPFAELNVRGELIGYDADIARSMAEMWGVEVNFIQMTRSASAQAKMLRSGEADMLIGAQVNRRENHALMEYTQTYFLGQQSMMVRADDEAASPDDLNGRTIGVVIASPSEEAARDWVTRNNLNINIQTFMTLDRAHAALENNQVAGVVDSDYRLQRVSQLRPELIRILEQPIQLEPFAIAVLRQDVGMRELVNRSLQFLTVSGQMEDIHQSYFPGAIYDYTLLWANLGDEAPDPAQFESDLPFPEMYIVPRLQGGQPVRVTGLNGVMADSDAPESERRLDVFHRELIQEMASRWGVEAEFVPGSPDQAVELIASGQADIALGLTPDWNAADRIDYSGYYLLHGERLMVRMNDDIRGFSDLGGGRTVLTPNNEPTAASRAVVIAESVNARIEIEQVPENSLGFAMLADEDTEVGAAFGDSLRLIPHVQSNADLLRLTRTDDDSDARWYSKSVMALGVPRNDIDFRLLVEYTLQELIRDGTLERLLQPLVIPGEQPVLEIWPGSANYLGFTLAR